MTKLEHAFTQFDAYNKEDPNTIEADGITYPSEYFYALQLYNWVLNLQPLAGETLLLASRSQHIGRWKIPRQDYAAGKVAYYKWRTDLAKFHADTAGTLMTEAGYEEQVIEKVQQIILKKNLKADVEVQIMENALCLVFLQFQYEDFLHKHDEEKVIRILRKSWAKMDEAGRQAALTLPFEGIGKDLLEKALAV